MPDQTQTAKRPRYVEISGALRRDIAQGVYPVGGLLPSEAALCRRFDVSRFTVREALRRLQSDGMVARVQGAGSRVLRDAPAGVFIQNYGSVSELTQYAAETRLELIKVETAILEEGLAEHIGGAAGETWTMLRSLRRAASGEPIAFVESYVPSRFADLAPDLARGAGPIYAGLSKAADDPILRAEQDVQALPAPDHVAQALRIAAGAPTLRILRRYYASAGPLIASFNWHMGGDRYIHRTRLELAED